MIAAHRVHVAGSIATSNRRQVSSAEPVLVRPPAAPFVSRAGAKLAGALDHFGIDVTGRAAVDAGSSTGGFTDCLLQRGAEQVVAVDIGTHQLHERLRDDPRVDVREQTDIRDVSRSSVDARTDLVVADLSFRSLAGVVDPLVELAGPAGELVLLVKPQFEATKQEADRGSGVISDPLVWRRTVEEVIGALDGAGAAIMGAMCSPLRGSHGNVEFLLHAVREATRAVEVDVQAQLDDAIEQAMAG